MRNKLFRVVSDAELQLIKVARSKKPKRNIDYEHKSHHGAYADDEREEECDHPPQNRISLDSNPPIVYCNKCGRRSHDF